MAAKRRHGSNARAHGSGERRSLLGFNDLTLLLVLLVGAAVLAVYEQHALLGLGLAFLLCLFGLLYAARQHRGGRLPAGREVAFGVAVLLLSLFAYGAIVLLTPF